MYNIRKALITPLSADDDETNYVDKYTDMIACAPNIKRGIIAAADEAGLDLQVTNGPWYLK